MLVVVRDTYYFLAASLLVKVAALSRNPSDFAVSPSIVIGSDPVSGHDVKLIIRLFI